MGSHRYTSLSVNQGLAVVCQQLSVRQPLCMRACMYEACMPCASCPYASSKWQLNEKMTRTEMNLVMKV